MTRIESSQSIEPPKASKTLRRFLKTTWYVISFPFKFSLKGIAIAILVLLFIAVLLTGVWHVPVASTIVYHEPKPVREVGNAVFSATLFQMQTEEKISDASFGTIQIELSEEQLNALFQDIIASSDSFPFLFSQVAIEDSFIEFFGTVKSRPQVIIRGHLIPFIEGDNLRFRIEKISVGQLPIPRWLVPSSIFDAFTPSLVSGILDVASIQSVQLSERHMILFLHSL